MPVAVGMYLPFGLSTPILIGGLIAHFLNTKTISDQNSDNKLQNGILLSSGLIAGESLMGILLAFVASAGIKSLNLELHSNLVTSFTIISAIAVIFWFYRESKS